MTWLYMQVRPDEVAAYEAKGWEVASRYENAPWHGKWRVLMRKAEG